MDDISFSIKGADKLAEEMQRAIRECPDELNKALRKVGREFGKDVNGRMPGEYSGGLKKWKTKATYGPNGIIEEVDVVNRSSLFHLVENGHEKWIRGVDTGGWVPGRHIAEDVREEYRKTYPQVVEEAVDSALGKAGLA